MQESYILPSLIIAALIIAWLLLYVAQLSREIDSKATAKFEQLKRSEITREVQLLFDEWRSKSEKQIREDAIRRSRSVTIGKVMENLVPYFPSFKFDPQDARFLGSPIDLIVFDGMSADEVVREIVFIEVKTGNSNLSDREKLIREAVVSKRVKWMKLDIDANINGGERIKTDHVDYESLTLDGINSGSSSLTNAVDDDHSSSLATDVKSKESEYDEEYDIDEIENDMLIGEDNDHDLDENDLVEHDKQDERCLIAIPPNEVRSLVMSSPTISEPEYIINYRRQLQNPWSLISRMKSYIEKKKDLSLVDLKSACVQELGCRNDRSGSINASLKVLKMDGYVEERYINGCLHIVSVRK